MDKKSSMCDRRHRTLVRRRRRRCGNREKTPPMLKFRTPAFSIAGQARPRGSKRTSAFSRATRVLSSVTGALVLIAAAAVPQVDLVLNVTDAPDPIPRTGLLTYSVNIANNGVTTATGVSYLMDVPVSSNYAGYTTGTGAVCSGMTVGQAGPAKVTCTHPELASTATASFTIALRPQVQGTTVVASSVTSIDPDVDEDNNSVSNTTTVQAGADFGIVLSGPATLPSGSNFNYSLAINNIGPDPASSLRITFPLPTGFTQSGAVPAGCSVASNTLTCNIAGPIASGSSLVVGNVPGKITAWSSSNVTGTASIALQPGAAAGTPQDPNPANNTSVFTIAVTAGSDVRLSKSRSAAGPYFVGSRFNFVLTAAYDGDIPTGLTIRDTIPANYIVGAVAASQNGWTCAASGQIVTCTRPSGGAAGNNQALGSVTIPVTIASVGSNVTNIGWISTSSPPDPLLSNNVATDGGANLFDEAADLTIAKTGPNSALAVVGVPFNWTLTASNIGPSAFYGQVVVTDSLPANVTVNSYTLNGWSCSPAAPVVGAAVITCNRAYSPGSPLAPSTSAPPIVLNVTASAVGAITNRARVSSVGANVSDPTGANNNTSHTVTVATTVPTSADMEVVSKVPSASSIGLRRPYSWTIRVRNNTGAGLAEAHTVIVTDNLPSGMELTGAPSVLVVSGTTTATTCTGTAGQTAFTCNLGTVSSGAVVDISVPVRNLTSPAGGTSTNTASVTTVSIDVEPGNNSISGSVTVTSSSIAGLVFRDFNNNGTQEGGDTGIGSITMALTGQAFDLSAVSRTVNTNASTGVYSFSGLPEGTYSVQRGTVSEPYLTVGIQTAGSSGGNATTAPDISAIGLAENVAATDYNYAYVPQARIGLFKRLPAPQTNNLNGSFTATLRIGVVNPSLEALNAVTVSDPLTGAAPLFGTFVAGGAAAILTAGTYTIEAAPSVVGACVATSNAAFDGNTTTVLGTIGSLAPLATCEFEFQLRYGPVVPLPAGGYENQASGAGAGALSGQTLSDLSHDGPNADPDGDGNPGNNNQPTPLSPILLADVTTVVTLPAMAVAGSPVAGTALYRNIGPYAAANVVYTMTLTANVTGVTLGNLPTGASFSYDAPSGVVTFTGMPTTLAAGQIASGNGTNAITVNYMQNTIANSTLSTTIATSTNEGANAGPNSATANVTGALLADVTTALNGFPALAPPGTMISGTVLFRNGGPSVASGVTYTLTLSPGLTGVVFGNLPAGVTALYNPGNGVVTLTGMPTTVASGVIVSGDGVAGIQISYVQPVGPHTDVTSTIGTTTSQGANVLPDNATVRIIGQRSVDIGVVKSASFTEAAPGDTVTYRVRTTNHGPVDLPQGTTLLEQPGPGLQLIGSRCANIAGNLCLSGPPATDLLAGAVLPALPVGGFNELLIDAIVTAAAGNTITNTARVAPPSLFRDTLLANNVASVGPLPVRNSPDLKLTKTAIGTFISGGNAAYLLTVRNVGKAATTGVTHIVDVLPAGLTFVSGTGAGWTCSVAGQTVTCSTAAILAPNSSSEVTLNVAIAPGLVGPIANTAIVSTPGDPVPPNDSDAITTPVQSAPDLVVTKVADADTLRTGSTHTYTIAVRNVGNGPTTAPIIVSDLVPAGLVPTLAGGGDFVCSINGQQVDCTRTTSLAAGATATVSITVAVSSSQPLVPVTNTACAQTSGELNTTNNCGEVISSVGGAPVVRLRKTALGAFSVGAAGTFRLVVRNEGSTSLGGPITVVDTLPAGLIYLSAQGTGWVCSAAGNVVRCVNPGPIAAGDSSAVTLTASITAAALPQATNCAVVSVPNAQVLNGGRDCVTIVPTQGPDLEIIKTVSADTLIVGQNATWFLTITNKGSGPTTGVTVATDTLPAGLIPIAATGVGVTCTVTGQIVRCERNTPIAAGETIQISITTQVTAAAGSSVSNGACVSTAGDINAANDCNRITTPVQGRREATFAKQAVGDFLVGQRGTFRLVLRNTGTVPLRSPISLVDTLPAGLTFVSATGMSDACGANGNVVTCSFSQDLAPGDSAVVAISALIGPAAAPEFTNCATVQIAGGAIVANNGRSCVTVRPEADYRLVLEISTPRYERELRDTPDFTVLVRNVGRSPLPTVLVTNALPKGFTYVPTSSWRGGRPDRDARQRIADPSGGAGPSISWPIGDMQPGQVIRVDYRALIGLGASFDVDNVTASSAVSEVPGLRVESNVATVPIKLTRGLFDQRGVISGKVYVQCDCDNLAGQGDGEVGVPGVRMLLEDGTGAITDSEGKYNFINVRAGLHVVKVDRSSLPSGERLVALNTRNAFDPYSRFVDLKAGELHRADFAEGSRDARVLEEVLLRRRGGEVRAAADSSGLGQLLATPMAAAPTVVGAQTAFISTASVGGSTYSRLIAANGLHDGNSSLPTPPLRALAALSQQPGTASGRIVVDLPATAVPADGRRALPVTVRVLDSLDQPIRGNVAVTLEASAGEWRVPDADGTARATQVVISNGAAEFLLLVPNDPARAQVRATSATATTTRDITFVPAPRPFLASGLIQGRLDLRSLTQGSIGLSSLNDGFEESLNDIKATGDSGRVRAGARGAILLKGDVKGAGLLTLAFDSERDPARTQFRDITPDNGYAVFGDASIREFDAQSQQRLYARLDRGSSFLRYGDFATPRSDERRLLLAYDRSMTGLTYHAEGTRGQVTTFASRNGIRQIIDEIRGRGLSGPYLLSRQNTVVNSERVELITRDRNQPAVILKAQPMARFEDYTVEPFTGRLLFRAPVASLDANLNPVSIRVSYEVEQAGEQFWTYGGDGRAKLGRRVEVGGFAVRDENPIDEQTLLGASLGIQLGVNTTLSGEVGRTVTGIDDLTGSAWRIELRHQSARIEGRVFAIQGDSGFVNRSSTFVGGRSEFGAKWSATLNDRTRLIADAIHTSDDRTDGRRDGVSVGVERRLTDRIVAELGYRWADENGASVTPTISGQFNAFNTGPTDPNQGLTPLSFNAARARITARTPGADRSTLFAEYEYGLDASSARRGSVGGEYLMFDRTRAYLRHEWISSGEGPYALGQNDDQQNTVFGIDADYLRNGQVFSEYRSRDAFNGRDAEASMGLRNRWAIAPGILANTSFERITPLINGDEAATFAATGALEWTKSSVWKGTARIEYRDSPTGENVLGSLGYARKLDRDWTLLGRSIWDQINTNAARGRSQLGLAWRQTDQNHVNALFRLENRLDRTDAQGIPSSKSIANIAALLLNVQPVPTVTFSTRYAGKLASDTRDGITDRTSAHLLMGRTIVDLTKRTDVGLIGSVLGDGKFVERRYGMGVELGAVVMRNLRLAGGWNVFGFTDRDFDSLGYTQRGPYVEFGFKFDEDLFRKGGK